MKFKEIRHYAKQLETVRIFFSNLANRESALTIKHIDASYDLEGGN